MTTGPVILHSVHHWLPQTQTWLFGQVAELQGVCADTHVACEATANLEQYAIANLHSFSAEPPFRRYFDLGLRKLRIRRHLNYLVRIGEAIGADIVHSHFGNIGWGDLGAVKRLGARHVTTFYGVDVNRFPVQFPVWRKRYGELFAQVDLVLCEGSHMASCIAELGCELRKIRVHHLGVDTGKIDFQPRQWRGSEPLKVLIAASFREKKGIPCAIAALARVRSGIPLELTIIGDAGADGESRAEKARILEALGDAGMAQEVRMLGYQPHGVMLREALQHHVFLHPSITASNGDTEGGAPVTILEMLAAGMPVVSTRHCDIPEIMGKDLGHLLAPERDVAGLAAILGKLASDPGAWEAMAIAGRKHVEAEYDKKVQGRRLLGLYEELLARGRSHG